MMTAPLFSAGGDNEIFRALLTLPPLRESSSTQLAIPEAPPKTVRTGDREVDAILWLSEVVRTGHQTLIDKAMEAAKQITTPMEKIGERYAQYLHRSGAHPLQVAFGSFGFGDLENIARRSIEKRARQHEAMSRFGSVENLFADTPAEKFCRIAIRGLKRDRMGLLPDDEARERFIRYEDLTPATVSDCLYGRAYWYTLYRLRNATDDYGDPTAEGSAHDHFCMAMLADVAPRSREEAVLVLDYFDENDSINDELERRIMRNLVCSGWGEKVFDAR